MFEHDLFGKSVSTIPDHLLARFEIGHIQRRFAQPPRDLFGTGYFYVPRQPYRCEHSDEQIANQRRRPPSMLCHPSPHANSAITPRFRLLSPRVTNGRAPLRVRAGRECAMREQAMTDGHAEAREQPHAEDQTELKCTDRSVKQQAQRDHAYRGRATRRTG